MLQPGTVVGNKYKCGEYLTKCRKTFFASRYFDYA
jgi:hypothetical protein